MKSLDRCGEWEKSIESITGMTIEECNAHVRWVHRQNVIIVMEHAKSMRQEFFKLKASHDSLDRNILSLSSEYIAARKIRKRYDTRFTKDHDGNIEHVKNTIEKFVRKNAKTRKRPVMKFLLERYRVVMDLRNHGYSYREISLALDRLFPRKKLKISHTSIMRFFSEYCEGEPHNV